MAYSSTSSNSEVSTNSKCSSSCLENVKILKEQNEQLLKDLRTSKLKCYCFKKGLESVEGRLLVYKKIEVWFMEEDIKVLKREIHLREVAITDLRRKLELAQKQKDEIQLTVENVKNSSKNLSKLINCQIVDKYKTGLGYNVVPPPYTRNFMPPKPVCHSLVLDSEEENVSQTNIEKKTAKPSFVKIDFIKTKQTNKTNRKTAKQVEHNRQNTHIPRGNQRNWNNMMSQRLGSTFEMFNKACYVCGSFDHLQVIRCDNGTEFKNKEMNQFCDRKCIKREFSVARTPQQNEVAEMKNITLIEASRTMLADSKLPTTFWAEAINNACYVQNRVLVTKPHNKTPYELLLGRKPALGFMRPFRCLVTILNTIDHLGKFDGKADEGFLVGSGKARMEIVPGKDYILLPFWTVDPPFSQNSKSSPDAGFKPSEDDEKKVDEDPRKDSESIDQNKDDNVTSTNNVNAASTNEVNAVGGKISIELPDDPNMPALEDIVYLGDDEDVGAEADMNNLDAFMPVSPIPTTRVHKDHPVEQIIGDLNSASQTRRMTKNLEEHGLFSSVQQEQTIKTFKIACLLVFYHKKNPKRYGYCKNRKKTVKAGQTRTRERKENTRAGRMLSKVNQSQHTK
ncbi:ribonuclease H-like domain-containing protein [Tanacetum coccineum]